MTGVYIIAQLAEREFGGALLRVSDLRSWAQSKRIAIPCSRRIDDHEFVHVETLLNDITGTTSEGVSLAAAVSIVENDPALSSLEYFRRKGPYHEEEGLDPIMCRLAIATTAQGRWRRLLEDAVRAGELQLLDFASKLPIAGAAREPGPVNEDQEGKGALKPVPRSAAQDTAVLSALKALKVDPLAVPRNQPGKAGIKSKVKAALVGKCDMFQAEGQTFAKTWERLRKAGEIKDA